MSARRRAAAVASYTPAQLAERAIYRRAIEAAIWGMPAVNYELMYREMVRKLKGGDNQILYWSRLLDWKNQTLTPNPDVIYLMPFINLKDVGPMVLEVPPADDGLLNGSLMNLWQAAIEDIGPGGVDEGEGGRYLILPPGHDPLDVPAGYIPMPCDTYQAYGLVRSLLESGSEADVAKAVTYGRRMRLYPLSRADDPPETIYVDAADVLFDSTIPYDLRFFESLDRVVQAEPWLERDRVMIDQLRSIGIERGKPFRPSPKTQRILNDAMLEAKAELEARYLTGPPFYPDGHWFFPVPEELNQSIQSFFTTPDSYPVDARGTVYTFAFFSAKHVGAAQFYVLTDRDHEGKPLEGSLSYRIRVPAHVPVTKYWSMTVYDRETHAFIKNAMWVGRSSQTPGLQVNPDGSVDIFFGAKGPEGRESNWVPTELPGRFEVLARLYGPEKPLFEKTAWRLPDIERIPRRAGP